MRIVIKSCWVTIVITLVSLALMISLARLTLPAISEYKHDIEGLLEETLGQALSIGEIEAQMRGFYPSLHLINVSMLDKTTSEPLLFFDEVYIDIDVVTSLFNWRPELRNLTLVGLDLAVERAESGQLLVAGVKGGETARESALRDDGNALEWFLSQDKLLLEKATIRWRDTFAGMSERVFTSLNFTLINENGHNQLVGQGYLPGDIAGQFDFAFDFRDVDFSEGLSGEGFVSAQGAMLSPWQYWLLGEAAGYGLEATVDFEAWLSWQRGHLVSIDAQAHGHEMTLKAPKRSDLRFEQFDVNANWRLSDAGWDLQINDFVVASQNLSWQLAQSGISFQKNEQVSRFDFGLSGLDVALLSKVAQHLPHINDDVKGSLAKLKPQAEVKDFYLRLEVPEQGEKGFFARASLQDLSLSSHENIPGVKGLDGDFYIANEGWVFDVNTQDASVKFRSLFRDPLKFSLLKGVIIGEQNKDEWRVWTDQVAFSNEHLAASAYFSMQNEQAASSPELDLVVSVERANGRHTSKYLPVGIMHETVVEWLDRSIIDAEVTSGGVTFRGPVKSFPFDNRDGRFEVQASFEDGVLSYMPGWAPIVDITGQLTFNEQSMVVYGETAMTLDSELSNVTVSIPKFKAKDRALYIDGKAQGPTSDGVLFLTTTPLVDSVGKPFVNTSAAGESKLELSLRIPLNKHEKQVAVDGRVNFHRSDLVFQDLGVDIKGVDGGLSFTQTGVSAEKLAGKVLGFPVEAKVSMANDDVGKQIVIEGHGLADPELLHQRFYVPVFKNMQGQVPWYGRLVLPFTDDASLEVFSSLEGVEIAMPSPLHKPASDGRDTHVSMRFPFSPENVITLKHGDDVRGVFELASSEDGLGLRRGELRYAGGDAKLPVGDGVRIVGRLPHYDHESWMDYIFSLAEEGEETADPVIASLELYADEAYVYGQVTKNVTFEMVEAQGAWLGEFDSTVAAGRIVVPGEELQPVRVDLDYLFFQMQDDGSAVVQEASSDDADPREIGSLNLIARAFYLDNALLGRLDVELEPEANGHGAEIRRADINGDYLRLASKGAWLVVGDAGEQQTSIEATVDSDDMGTLLGLLGYVDNIKKGVANNRLSLAWEGGVDDFALEKLHGEVVFDIQSGTLLDVDPGAGRIFALLSIQALPRRLSLDFSDLFSKGLAFDSVRGKVKLNEGEAFTDDLRLQGPSADISITGYIDLVGKKYNQYVTVEPNYTGTLPLAIAVIANPAAGVAAWFAEKLLRRPVSDIAKILYHVSGDWDDPEIKRLGRIEYFQQQEELLSQ